jgi:hypothetical protein
MTDPQPDAVVPGPVPGLDRLRRLTAHCRRCQHQIGEYVGDNLIVFGGLIRRAPTPGKCQKCGGRCVIKPLSMGG